MTNLERFLHEHLVENKIIIQRIIVSNSDTVVALVKHGKIITVYRDHGKILVATSSEIREMT